MKICSYMLKSTFIIIIIIIVHDDRIAEINCWGLLLSEILDRLVLNWSLTVKVKFMVEWGLVESSFMA